MNIGIIQFPGSNCERETMMAVKRAGMHAIEFLWNESREKLRHFDGYIIVGGFSYEDRSRAGAIAALDPVMQIIREESQQGKPVLGICNGAQILVETGLVPGLEKNKVGMALTDNKRIENNKVLGTGYYNAWIHMRLHDAFQRNAFTRHLTNKNILRVPVAHAEGRFIIPPALLMEMEQQGLGVFQYCDANGLVTDEFPVNPNGSIHNIAAVSNKAGNVMAMMPHPERTEQGDAIFYSMRDYIKEKNYLSVANMHYSPRPVEIQKYQPQHHEWIVDLMITDNVAMSVQQALQQIGIPVDIKRYVHWEIACEESAIAPLKSSGVLFNNRKEILLSPQKIKQTTGKQFLVRSKEDMIGQQRLQMLQDHTTIEGVTHIQHSILWCVFARNENDLTRAIDSHILFNRYAHDCYDYSRE